MVNLNIIENSFTLNGQNFLVFLFKSHANILLLKAHMPRHKDDLK
jgi:hypothetical protein